MIGVSVGFCLLAFLGFWSWVALRLAVGILALGLRRFR